MFILVSADMLKYLWDSLDRHDNPALKSRVCKYCHHQKSNSERWCVCQACQQHQQHHRGIISCYYGRGSVGGVASITLAKIVMSSNPEEVVDTNA